MPRRYEPMWTAGRTAKKVFKQPGTFALAVIKQFRANQGVLLAGAVAYYTLLSLVPLLILILLHHHNRHDRNSDNAIEYGAPNQHLDGIDWRIAEREAHHGGAGND